MAKGLKKKKEKTFYRKRSYVNIYKGKTSEKEAVGELSICSPFD